MNKHWFYHNRISLLQKIAHRILPFSASTLLCDDEQSAREFIGQWRIAFAGTVAVQNSIKKTGKSNKSSSRQQPALSDKADIVLITELDRIEAAHWYGRCNDGGVLIIDQGDSKSSKTQEILCELKAIGFDVELTLNYGFFARFWTAPCRWLGVKPKKNHPPLLPLNAVLYALGRLELLFLPAVRFLFGETTLIVAKKGKKDHAIEYDLSIIIPAYNEEKRIGTYLDAIHAYLRKRKINAEVLVVDDGSRDNTVKVSDGYYPNVRCVSLYRNFGKGGAIKEGVALAKGWRILFADADGATPIHELEKLEQMLERGKDIAIGSRWLERSNVTVKQSLARRILSRLGNLAIRFFTGLFFNDTQCGFKLFEREPAKILFKNLTNLRFGFDFEILKFANQQKYSIAEVAVEWHDVAGSKATAKESLYVLWELFRMQFQYFFKFSIVGVLNTAIDYAIHNTLIMLYGKGDVYTQVLYQGIGFIGANVFSYLVNSGFTFKTYGKYWKFFGISFITLVLSLLSFYGLNVLLNPSNEIYLSNILKLSTVTISFITNYFGYKLLVFKINH